MRIADEARVGAKLRRRYEMTLAVAIMALGVMFSAESGIFETGLPLNYLSSVAPHWVWGQALTIIGCGRLVALIVNGHWPLGPRVRWWLSSLCIPIWALIAVGYWLNLPTTSAFPTLVFGPVALLGEVNCLTALSALLAGQRNDQ